MIERLLRRWVPFKEIGWAQIGEVFTRFSLLKTPYGSVYLHRLIAPMAHTQCHDHPWWFVAILLKGGYSELHRGQWTWRRPGSVLYRPATFRHNVVTHGVSWSIIIAGPKSRAWGFTGDCQ